MATTTRVGAAQDALDTLLAADGTLSSVYYGLGQPRNLEREHVWISGSVVEWSSEVEVTGQNAAGTARRESFVLQVCVYVSQASDTYDVVRDRCITLVQAVEGVIRTNSTLTSNVRYADLAGVSLEEGIADSQRIVAAVMDVRCEADITAA